MSSCGMTNETRALKASFMHGRECATCRRNVLLSVKLFNCGEAEEFWQ